MSETLELHHLPDGRLLQIFYEQEPESPLRLDDAIGRAYCWHRRYNLGHADNPYAEPRELSEALAEEFGAKGSELLDAGVVLVPLYLYDHSGLTMSTHPYSDPWDSGQVGWWVIKPAEVKEHFGGDRDKARAYVDAEIRQYADYLEDDVYRYEITDASGTWESGAGNFYGSDHAASGLYESAGYVPEKVIAGK
jgi:hypothetical protein